MIRSFLSILGATLACAALASPARADDDDEDGAAQESDYPPLSVYGFARLDILANDSRMSDLGQPRYVLLEKPDGQYDGALTMTPRLSRVGISIDKWKLASDVTAEGKLEVDFSGGSGINTLRLRQAYGSVDFAKKVQLLAGQTADLVSPLFPSAQNDTQLLFAGNTGDRRPQLQLSIFPSDKVRIAAGIAPSGFLASSGAYATPETATDTGPNAHLLFQWLLEMRQRWGRGGVGRLGVWGTAGSDALPGQTERQSTWTVGVHAFVPIDRKVAILGEAYAGDDVADLGGGVGQRIDVDGKAIRSIGGWMELAVIPNSKHMYALGASIDTAETGQLQTGDRYRNRTIYAVLRYRPRPAIQIGLEYLNWRTDYLDVGHGMANRGDVHFSVFF